MEYRWLWLAAGPGIVLVFLLYGLRKGPASVGVAWWRICCPLLANVASVCCAVVGGIRIAHMRALDPGPEIVDAVAMWFMLPVGIFVFSLTWWWPVHDRVYAGPSANARDETPYKEHVANTIARKTVALAALGVTAWIVLRNLWRA